jgi:sugar O-acyltransferase (sialic acid O-acetyltransferase NeuD family)
MGSNEASTPLIVVGAGGFSRETADAVRACIDRGDHWKLLGFVDDDPDRTDTTIDGLSVLGPIETVRARTDTALVVGTGRPDNYTSRLRIVRRLGLPRDRYASIVHPDASISDSTTIGAGTVVLAGTVTTTSVRIGNHVAIMPGVVLTHDDLIEDYATITSGVRLGGTVQIGTGAYIGAGALVREGVSIGAWSMIGMGSVVTRDVPAGELWFGSPARNHGDAPVPTDLLVGDPGAK